MELISFLGDLEEAAGLAFNLDDLIHICQVLCYERYVTTLV